MNIARPPKLRLKLTPSQMTQVHQHFRVWCCEQRDGWNIMGQCVVDDCVIELIGLTAQENKVIARKLTELKLARRAKQ